MNNARRKAIAAIVADIEKLRASADAIAEAIEAVRDEESDYLDNMPESLQNGDKGERAQSAIDALDEALSAIQGLEIDEYAIDQLNTAAE